VEAGEPHCLSAKVALAMLLAACGSTGGQLLLQPGLRAQVSDQTTVGTAVERVTDPCFY